VGKGGIVKDEAHRLAAVDAVRQGAEGLGFLVEGVCESPITGQKGNIEYFIYMKRG
jgi:23S rRNA (cytidine1920-2'-O)/16S rRNA (cytidine1409-2'-O)-methyltransferase